jgi:hypothetical protein
MSDRVEVLRQRGGWWEDELEARDGPPFGPRNTYSNLAYAIAGVLVPDPAFALAMAGLAVASGLYHATKEVWAHRLDIMGIYLVMGYVAGVALGLGPGAGLSVGAGIAVLFTAKLDESPGHDLFVRVGLLLGVAMTRSAAWLASLALFSAAMMFWQLDQRRVLVGRWGHAMWHVLTAAAIAVLRWGIVG